MIQNIIFDLGNVLLNYDASKVIKSYTQDDQLIQQAKESIFSSYQWALLDGGLIDESRAAQQINQRFYHKALIEYCLKNWPYYNLSTNPDLIHFVKQCLDDGMHCYILSNAPKAIEKTMHQYIPYVESFKKIYISANYRLMKPQVPLFEIVVNENHLDSNQCLFIDDLYDNLLAARSIGMHTFQYLNNPNELMQTYNKLKGN